MPDVPVPVRVLYLDVDGTIRKGYGELGRWVNGPEDVEVFPGVPELLLAYRKAGWRIVTISNQGGIALGHVARERVWEGMNETHRQCGEIFDHMTCCEHHPDADNPFDAVCWCRKPRIGLVLQCAGVLYAQNQGAEIFPPHLALMVGDRPEDEQCAANANITFLNAAAWRGLGRPISNGMGHA